MRRKIACNWQHCAEPAKVCINGVGPAFQGKASLAWGAGQKRQLFLRADNHRLCPFAARADCSVNMRGPFSPGAIANIIDISLTAFNAPLDPDGNLPGVSRFEGAPDVWVPTARCLGVLAFNDYFPNAEGPHSFFSAKQIRTPEDRFLVSEAILAANPGWCGTFGPGVDATTDLLGKYPEGNYDMSQMHLLKMAYRFYAYLTPPAQEHLITRLLKDGRIHRPGKADTFTRGGMLNDWFLSG
jgi:hypothetical protein